MEIREITEKSVWENFLLGIEEKTFLQSWNWGEFQQKMGNKIWRLGVFDIKKRNFIGIALITKIIAKRGTYLLIQHGPVIKVNEKKEVFLIFLEEIKKIAKRERAVFLRMNPLWDLDFQDENVLKDFGFIAAPMHANAYEATWKLDLPLTEEELFKNMRKTTRYVVRQTLNNPDVSITLSNDIKDIPIYQKLNEKVEKHQKFTAFSEKYLKNEFEVFLKDNQVLLFFGKAKGELACASLVIFWSGCAFYHQAASDEKYKKLSIPYLLQWEAIKEAKKRGCVLYDFWGFVDPEKYSKHPWAGPTLFKMGFGGYKKEYIKTHDLPLSRLYWINFFIETLRKKKRGL